MRMKSLILIFIALGCGLVASIGISQVMNRGGAGSLEMDQIMVALTDVDIGTKLDANNVKLEDWPKNKIPDGAVRRLEDVKDKYANARFFKGEPLHISKISDNVKNVAIGVPPGYRAMPVKVDEDTVIKAVTPGDRVDVMVFLRKNGQDILETGAFTILKNVRVFAINTNTERVTDSKGETASFKTVSLLVKPEHAQELVVAAQMGKIMLTLRRPDETDKDAGEEVTPLSSILSGRSAHGSEPGSQSYLSVVKNDGSNGSGSALPPPTSGEAKWKMVIMGPSDRKQYEWYGDTSEMPVEVTVGSAPSSGSSPPPLYSPPPKSHTPRSEALENPDKPGVINAPALPDDGSTGSKSSSGKNAK
jgi:pilus assembly protein CpaB